MYKLKQIVTTTSLVVNQNSQQSHYKCSASDGSLDSFEKGNDRIGKEQGMHYCLHYHVVGNSNVAVFIKTSLPKVNTELPFSMAKPTSVSLIEKNKQETRFV